MPSPSQDSEKLTDAILALVKNVYAEGGAGEHWQMAPHVRALIYEVERHRTPPVPGEDMRAKADEWLAWMGWAGSPFNAPQSLAALLSSTAALAREEAAKAGRASLLETLKDAKWCIGAWRTWYNHRKAHGCDPGSYMEHLGLSLDREIRIDAAIRAIGKEG